MNRLSVALGVALSAAVAGAEALGAQSVPVPVFAVTSSSGLVPFPASKDSSIAEYVIPEFTKELAKKTKDVPFTLVDSRERARVVLEIEMVLDFCSSVPKTDGIMVGTLRFSAVSAPVQAVLPCLRRTKSDRYRALGKDLAGVLAKWGNEHRDDLASPSEVAGSFVGQYGYRIEIPAEYRAYPAITIEKTEVVFFGRSGADVTPDAGKRTRSIGPDESQYAERRIVRLEVWKKSKNELIRDIKEAVSASLDEKRETYTVSDVDVGRPAFLVHITKPKEIRQLVVEGTQTMFMFTGADEEQLVSLARGIK